MWCPKVTGWAVCRCVKPGIGSAACSRRARGERPHHVGDLRAKAVDRLAHPQAEIGRHLVVAAAPGVQALAGLADPLGQPRLDVHVDVLQRLGERKHAGRDLVRDRL